MQEVSDKFFNKLTQAGAKRLETVVEIYHQDATPTADGFDPSSVDCLFRFAKSANITFRGVSYTRLLRSVGRTKRTIEKELSSFSFTVGNETREIAAFERDTGFEGLICVKRLIDADTSTELADSAVQFTGRCEKPDVFDRSSESVSIKVKQILNQTEVNIPRRKFTVEDAEGRAPSDPLFEGFIYTPRSATVFYTEVEKKRFLLFFSKKKTVTRTLQHSSHSDLQAESVVPLALGRVQVKGINFASLDVGTGVRCVTFFAEGEIAAFVNLRSITPGFPLSSSVLKYGKPGGLVDDATHQANDDPTHVGAGIYSRLAYVRTLATGSRADTEDAAPDIVAILLGMKIPVADDDFTTNEFSDSAVLQSRWMLNSEEVFNLHANFIDDSETIESADYCDHILVDQANTERAFFPLSETGRAGTNYHNYRSTGMTSPEYWRFRSGTGTGYNAYLQEVEYSYYDEQPHGGDDPDGDGIPDYLVPPIALRRRYTSNVYLSEQMKAIDFMFDILFASSNLFLVQKASGKLAIRVKKPVDFAFTDTANIANATELLIKNVNPFKTNPGRILIGANLPTSEVRKIISARFKADVSISISAAGGITASAATLTGGSDSVAPSATLTCTSETGTKTINIGVYTLTYHPAAADTTVTVAAAIAAMVNSHNELNKFVKAVWVAGESVATISSRVGYITLDAALGNVHHAAIADPGAAASVSAVSGGNLAVGKYYISYSFETIEGETLVSPVLEFNLTTTGKNLSVASVSMPARVLRVNWYVSTEVGGIRRRLLKTNDGSAFVISELPRVDNRVEPSYNDTAAECHRIALAFADKQSAQSNLAKSNMLSGTFKFPLGSRQPSTNRIVIKYRDSAADFKLTELRINDRPHQAKVKKVNPLEINGAAIDNYHQARRIGNQKIAELRDGDKFFGLSSDGEALLLEEGDVVTMTDESGDFTNEPCRIEDLEYDDAGGYPQASFTARKYRRRYYDDQIAERLVPLVIVTNSDTNTEQTAPTTYLISAVNAEIVVGVLNYSVHAVYRQIEVSTDADFSVPANITITIENTLNTPGYVLRDRFSITRSTNLENAETRYVRVSHSSNGNTYGATSTIRTVIFPDDEGNGGSTPAPPTPPPTTTGTGTTPPGIPPGDCFTGDTLVTTANGDRITFEYIYKWKHVFTGKEVLAFDAERNLRSGKIKDVYKNTAFELLHVEFENGNKLRMVKTHRFWTENEEFVSMYLLSKGERVWHHTDGWQLVAIRSMEIVEYGDGIDVYNMTVADYHDYFADGFAVSNTKPRGDSES